MEVGKMKSAILNKSSIGIVIVGVIAIILFAGYHLQKSNNASDEAPQVIHGSLSLSEEFHSIKELRDRAELIALVSVKNAKPLSVANATFTLSESEIVKVFKGKPSKSVINILETGGIDEKGRMVVFDENPVFRKNEQAIVFLERYVGNVADDAYVILGVYQGKFIIDDQDKIIPPKNVSEKLVSITSRNELLKLLNTEQS
jgi:hypothetical protein